jgi:hypothetical protein
VVQIRNCGPARSSLLERRSDEASLGRARLKVSELLAIVLKNTNVDFVAGGTALSLCPYGDRKAETNTQSEISGSVRHTVGKV